MADLHVQAQDVRKATLRWELSASTDLQTQVQSDYEATLKTSTNQVTWEQRNGTRVTTYAITSVEGAWTDVSLEGSLTYNLSRNNRNSRMTFTRNGQGAVTVTWEVLTEGQPPFRQQFQVSNVTLEP